MGGRKDRKIYPLGDSWLSKRPGSQNWYRTYFDAEARQTRRVSLGTPEIEEAKRRLDDWYFSQHQLKKAKSDEIYLDEILLRYFDNHAVKLASAKSVLICLRHWSAFFDGQTLADTIVVSEQRRFHNSLRSKGLSDGYISKVVAIGRAAIRYAWQNGEIESEPFILPVHFDQPEPMGRPLDLGEVQRLVAAAEEPHVVEFVHWMIGTCARPSTIYELMTDQIKLDHKLIELNRRGRRQTKKYRPTVKLPEQLEDRATRLIVGASASFVPVIRYRGAAVKSVKTGWNAMRRRAGLDDEVKPYSLRHTMARYLRSQSVPPWEVAAQLGHKMPGFSTTEIYAPYDPAYLERSLSAINSFLEKISDRT